MKAMAGLGIILALFFAIIAVVAFMGLQDDAGDIAGLDAPVVAFFSNISNLAVLLVTLLLVIGLIAGFSLLRH